MKKIKENPELIGLIFSISVFSIGGVFLCLSFIIFEIPFTIIAVIFMVSSVFTLLLNDTWKKWVRNNERIAKNKKRNRELEIKYDVGTKFPGDE